MKFWRRPKRWLRRAVPDKYRVSRRARDDLLRIYQFTEARFGVYQAEAYLAGLERTFGLLGDFPLIGASADEVIAGLRKFRFQAHNILYSCEDDGVLIRSMTHVSQELRSNLFE
jgi:toxin ParE1/3/4